MELIQSRQYAKIYNSKINNEIYFIEEILDSNNNILE